MEPKEIQARSIINGDQVDLYSTNTAAVKLRYRVAEERVVLVEEAGRPAKMMRN